MSKNTTPFILKIQEKIHHLAGESSFVIMELESGEELAEASTREDIERQCFDMVKAGNGKYQVDLKSLSPIYSDYDEFARDHIDAFDAWPVEFAFGDEGNETVWGRDVCDYLSEIMGHKELIKD